MLREKLKSRFLRPLLLLAALLALSQSASALSVHLVGSAPGQSWPDYTQECTPANSNEADCTISGIDGDIYFHVVIDGVEYGPASTSNFNLTGETGQKMVAGGLRTTSSVSAQGSLYLKASPDAEYAVHIYKEYSGAPLVEVTKLATPFPAGQTFYFKPNTSFLSDIEKLNFSFTALFSDGTTETPVVCQVVEDKAVYSFTVPATGQYTKVRIQRGEASWNNYTAYQDYSPAYNCIEMVDNGGMNWQAASCQWTNYNALPSCSYTLTGAQAAIGTDLIFEGTGLTRTVTFDNFDLFQGAFTVTTDVPFNGNQYFWEIAGQNVETPTRQTFMRLKGAPQGYATVTFTLYLASDGTPRQLDAQWGEVTANKKYPTYIKYQQTPQADGQGTWVDSDTKVVEATNEVEFSIPVKNGTHFGIEVNGLFVSPSGANLSVVNGTTCSLFSTTNNRHFVWNGAAGTMIVKLILNADGSVASAEFEGPELNYTNYYLGGIGGWAESGARFSAEGKLTLPFTSNPVFKLYNPTHTSSSHYFSASECNYDPNKIVASGENFTLKDFVGGPETEVIFTVSEDANGKPTLTASWVSLAIPFYPKGYTSEQALKELDPDTEFYYLTGHAINNGYASPEWQLLPGQGQYAGKYTLDFTWNNHWDGCAGGTSDNFMTLQVKYLTPSKSQAADKTALQRLDGMLKEGYHHAGVRLRAIYDPQLNQLTFKYLHLENGSWVEVATKDEADYLPFISLVGDAEWKQKDDVPTNIANEEYQLECGTTTQGWQNSWIQYDSDGNPVVSRDGKSVYYNTQWPPLEDIYFNTKFTEGGQEYDIDLTSRQFTFTPNGDRGTGNALKENPKYKNVDFGSVAGDEFIVYEVDNLWASGTFKIWSGWSGDRYVDEKAAEWNQNWNWGDIRGNYENAEAQLIAAGQTYSLGTQYGDMKFSGPTYLSRVYFFMHVDDPQGTVSKTEGKSRIYTSIAAGGAQIQASSHKDEYDMGLFLPKLTQLSGDNRVTSVKIEVFKASDPETIIGSPVFESYNLSCTASDFDNLFNGFQHSTNSANPLNYWKDGREYETTGYYQYRMTVSFSATEDAVVESNPFYIKGRPARLYTAQLVKLAEGGYVTYSPTATYALSVSGENGSLSVERIEVPSAEVYSAAENTWTDRVLIYALPSEGYEKFDTAAWQLKNLTTGQVCSDAPTDGKATFLYMADATALHQDFEMTYTYTTTADGSTTELTDKAADDIDLFIPSPRLLSELTVDVATDEEPSTFTVAGDDHIGDCENEDYPNDVEYAGRLRHISVSLPVEMPNATEELLALLPEGEASLTFTGSLAGQLQNAAIDLRAPEAQLLFAEQDIRTWLDDLKPELQSEYDEVGTYAYTPKQNTLKVADIAQNEVSFYKRAGSSVTVALSNPKVNSMKASAIRRTVYRVHVQPDPEVNEWVERICLGSFAVSDGWMGNMILDNENRVNSTIKTKFETVVQDAPERAGFYNESAAHFSFKSEDEHFGMNGQDHDKATNTLHHGGTLREPSFAAILKEESLGTWWDGMDQMHPIASLDVSGAHVYFFNVAEQGSVVYPSSAKAAPARVASRAAGTAEAFVGPHATYSFVAGTDSDFQTGVETVTAIGANIITGEGFIDLMGNDGGVFGTDGTVLYLGNGRVELPAGIYVVKTASEALKVIVK